jgi:hypothetical protein
MVAGECATSRTISLLDVLYAVDIIEMQAPAWHKTRRSSGSSVHYPRNQKTACLAAFRHTCTLVEDVRTAVQENSDFLIPVQQLLDRVNHKQDTAQELKVGV